MKDFIVAFGLCVIALGILVALSNLIWLLITYDNPRDEGLYRSCKAFLSDFRKWLLGINFIAKPVTPAQRRLTEQEAIEASAALVRRQIEKCRTSTDVYEAIDAVRDFKSIWGDSMQVRCWFDSLMLLIRGQENKILLGK